MARNTADDPQTFNRRALIMGGGGALVFAGIGAQLYNLQIRNQERYSLLSDDNQFAFRIQLPSRGAILDRFGVPVAENRDSYRIFLIAEQAGDVNAALDRLGQLMTIGPNTRERILRDIQRAPRFQPVGVAEDLDWATFSRINLHLPDLPGVMPDVGEVRTYPMPQAFSHVAGYVQSAPEEIAGDDPLLRHPAFRVGRAGAEQSRDVVLRGAAGQLKVEVNAHGRVIRELPEQSRAALAGRDVSLTIDAAAQRFAMERMSGLPGAAVTMDVHTGEILSLASAPGFDPNLFVLGIPSREFAALNQNEHRPLFNKALNGLYAPASTVKGMVSLAALKTGETNPSERVFCGGHTTLGNRRFHCWRRGGHGWVDMHEAIKVSCDVYFYEMADRVGINRLGETASELGFGERFDVGVPMISQAGGLFPSAQWKQARRGERWSRGDTYNTGIGQGFTQSSPLQLAVYTARMASGKKIEPTLFRRENEARFADLAFDSRALEVVRAAHVGVVHEPGGTAYWPLQGFGVGELQMAGKSGTAQVYSITAAERARGVRDTEDLPWRLRNHGLFIAYAPAHDPQYAVAVVLEHGGGGGAAAPVARDILKDL